MAVISRTFELLFSAKNKGSTELKKVEKDLEKTADKVSALNAKFNMLWGAAITQRAVSFVKSTLDANDALNDMADRTGVSVESLSKLSEVAEAGDTSVETLTKAFNKLNVQAVDTPEVFEALGVSVTDAAGGMKNSEQLFNDVADKISAIDNPARRAALATKVFGKAGLELMPILKNGSAGIRDWTNDAERLGAVTSTQLAEASGEFNDNLQRLQMAGKGFSNVLSSELLPATNLLVSTFIEYSATSLALSKSNEQTHSSVETLANSDAFRTLINVIGFVGDAIQGVGNVGELVFAGMKTSLGLIVNSMVTFVQMSVSVLKRDFTGAIAAGEQGWKQAKELMSDFGKEADKALSGERFSDKLTAGLKAAVAKAKAAAQEGAKELTKTATVSTAEAVRVTRSTEKQLDALGKVAEAATAKSKKALEEQKKVAEDFEGIVKSLTQKIPINGTLKQQLDAAEKADTRRTKAASVNQKLAEKDQSKADAKKLESLQKAADKAKEAAAAEASLVNQSRAKKAAAALEQEQTRQTEAADLRERQAIVAEMNEQQVSDLKKLDIRLAAMNELNDLYAQVKENAKTGQENEDVIKRLRTMGEMLKNIKEENAGIFAPSEIESFAKQVQELANTAAKADAEAAKKAEDETLTKARERIQELQKELLQVKFGIDEESVIAEADKLLETIQAKLKALVVPLTLKMPETFEDNLVLEAGATMLKRADGGPVYGPGTSRSDSIFTALSAGEYVQPTHIMKKPGMYRLMEYLRAGGDFRKLAVGRFADGGSYMSGGASMSAPSNTNLSVDLRTNSGNIRVNAGTTQNDLNAQLRQHNLRRS